MKVCFLCDDVTPDTGTGTYAVELLPRLRALGIECQVFCTAGRPVEALGDLEPRAVLTSWSNGYRKPWRVRRDARAVLPAMGDSDVVHALVEPYAPLAERLRCIRRAGEPRAMIVSALGTYAIAPFRHWYQRRVYTRPFRRAAAIACISRYTARRVENEVRATTRVIYLGVALERVGPADTTR